MREIELELEIWILRDTRDVISSGGWEVKREKGNLGFRTDKGGENERKRVGLGVKWGGKVEGYVRGVRGEREMGCFEGM